VNKKTGEFSAADLKKPIGRKVPGRAPNGEGNLLSVGPVKGRFVCYQCGHEHADSEMAREELGGNKGQKMCRACDVLVTSKTNGSFRYRGQTLGARQRANNKSAKRIYKNGRLPKWMFS
jgi:hypothetical protein